MIPPCTSCWELKQTRRWMCWLLTHTGVTVFLYSPVCGWHGRNSWCSAGFSLSAVFVCVTILTWLSVCAADCDCAVGRQALQLCPSQRGAVALVSVCGSWRASLGAGKQLVNLLSQTTLRECKLAGLVYLEFSIIITVLPYPIHPDWKKIHSSHTFKRLLFKSQCI